MLFDAGSKIALFRTPPAEIILYRLPDYRTESSMLLYSVEMYDLLMEAACSPNMLHLVIAGVVSQILGTMWLVGHSVVCHRQTIA